MNTTETKLSAQEIVKLNKEYTLILLVCAIYHQPDPHLTRTKGFISGMLMISAILTSPPS